MPVLHSLIGTVSKTDRRRFVECGCGWRYVSPLDDEEGRRDCSERHSQHELDSDTHEVWRLAHGIEVRAALARLSPRRPS
jgi:hypothetical protein